MIYSIQSNALFAALLEFAFANYLSRQSQGILHSRTVKCKQLELMVNNYFQRKWGGFSSTKTTQSYTSYPKQEYNSIINTNMMPTQSRKDNVAPSLSCNDGIENGICYTSGGINHIVRKRVSTQELNLNRLIKSKVTVG